MRLSIMQIMHPVLHITNEGLHYKDHMTPRKMKSLVDWLNGMSIAEIAKKHERSYGAIKARLMKHGLIN